MTTPARHRRWWLVLVLATVTLTACSTTTAGTGQVAVGQGTPSPTSNSLPTPPDPPTTALPSPPSLTTSSVALADRLLAAPSGSRPWANTWGDTAYPTITELVDHLYAAADQKEEIDALQTNGVDAIAHRTWIAADASQLDIVLLHFTTLDGAQTQYTRVSLGLATDADATRLPLIVPGFSASQLQAFVNTDLTRYGDAYARVVATVGNFILEEYFVSPAHINSPDLQSWVSRQLDLLS